MKYTWYVYRKRSDVDPWYTCLLLLQQFIPRAASMIYLRMVNNWALSPLRWQRQLWVVHCNQSVSYPITTLCQDRALPLQGRWIWSVARVLQCNLRCDEGIPLYDLSTIIVTSQLRHKRINPWIFEQLQNVLAILRINVLLKKWKYDYVQKAWSPAKTSFIQIWRITSRFCEHPPASVRNIGTVFPNGHD